MNILGLHKTYYGMFRGGTQGKGRDLGDLGRNKRGKIKEKGDKKWQLLASRARLLHLSGPGHGSLSSYETLCLTVLPGMVPYILCAFVFMEV